MSRAGPPFSNESFQPFSAFSTSTVDNMRCKLAGAASIATSTNMVACTNQLAFSREKDRASCLLERQEKIFDEVRPKLCELGHQNSAKSKLEVTVLGESYRLSSFYMPNHYLRHRAAYPRREIHNPVEVAGNNLGDLFAGGRVPMDGAEKNLGIVRQVRPIIADRAFDT